MGQRNIRKEAVVQSMRVNLLLKRADRRDKVVRTISGAGDLRKTHRKVVSGWKMRRQREKCHAGITWFLSLEIFEQIMLPNMKPRSDVYYKS